MWLFSRTAPFGPFVSAQHFYSPAPEKSYAQQLKDGVLSATLHTLNSDKVKPGFVSVLKKVGTKALQNMKSDKCLYHRARLFKINLLCERADANHAATQHKVESFSFDCTVARSRSRKKQQLEREWLHSIDLVQMGCFL